ncbi:ATP-binding protein [Streptomyces sp. NPDC058220]|uniref:ATP-binding protein n=1 Tax=unclassified Streptomyces TaxID=2593676 RepID=UPI00364A5C8C
MSLPLTRRIARAALIVAAGAAPVVGAAGFAHAAALPQATDLSAVTALDGAAVSDTVGTAGRTTTPVAQKMAGDTAGSAGEVLSKTASTATKGAKKAAAPADALGGGLPTGQLPGKGLPLG